MRTATNAMLVAVVICIGPTGCTDAEDAEPAPTTESISTTTTAPAAISVTLDLGACGFRPLALDGEQWLAADVTNSSWDGRLPAPSTYTGQGVFIRLSDTTGVYEDAAGLELDFVAYTGEGTAPTYFCRD